jgi:hypothetical protein
MAELLLYQKPIRLNRFAHAELCYTPPSDYMFCRALAAVPLMAVEFPLSCRQYPIVFVRAEDGTTGAWAILSLVAEENAYVDRQGRWTASYVPAVVRRYPFVLAEIPGKPTDFDVAIDEESPCFSRDHGQALFTAAGEPEPILQSQIEFLRAVLAEHQRTLAFAKALQEAEILTPRNVDIVRGDQQRFGMRNALVVDEAKLAALPAETVHDFLAKGYLGWIYSHLLSLQCFLPLANRAGQPLEDVVPWWAK